VNAAERCPKEAEVPDICPERGKDENTVIRRTRKKEYFIDYAKDAWKKTGISTS
jgi:hypothetical protein